MFNFNPLWKTLIDRNMKKTDLITKCHLTKQTIADMSKNKYVSLKSLDRICKNLHCTISDIIEYVEDSE